MVDSVYGGYYVGKILQTNGVKFVFALAGGFTAPILVGCNELGIRVVDVRHESTTVFAADAVSRLTDRIGVSIINAGQGITNSITAIKTAQMAHSPVVLICGTSQSILKDRDNQADLDNSSLIKPFVKWSTTIKSYKDLTKVNYAFYKAREGVPGPVFVEIPMNVLWPVAKVKEMLKNQSDEISDSISGRVKKTYIDRYIRRAFEGASYFSVPQRFDVEKKTISESVLEKIILAFEASERPVLLCGSQVVEDLFLINSIVESINKLNIPVFLTGMTRGLLGKDHPLQFVFNRKSALEKADLVIFAGVPFNICQENEGIYLENSEIINVNLDKEILNKQKDVTIKSNSHPGQFIVELSQSVVTTTKDKSNWSEILKEREENDRKELFAISKQKKERINSVRLGFELEKNLSENAIVIEDGGDFVLTMGKIIKPPKPLSWICPGPFGTLGVGAGFALAAKLFHPNKDVWILYGDGSIGYSLMEWDTFVRHKIPIIGLIGNNSEWRHVTKDQMGIFNNSTAIKLGDRPYEKVVEGFGAKGFVLKIDSGNAIESVLKQAEVITNAGLPVLINAYIDANDFDL